MISANEANRLTSEALRERESYERAELLEYTENAIKRVCKVGLSSVVVPIEEKHRTFLSDALITLGFEILSNDPELTDTHIVIAWS